MHVKAELPEGDGGEPAVRLRVQEGLQTAPGLMVCFHIIGNLETMHD